MNAYIKVSTMEYPRFIGDIQRENPNWDESQPLPDDWKTLTYFGQPICQEYETCDLLFPEEQLDGSWIITWSPARPMTEEEVLNYNKQKELIEKMNANQPVLPAIDPI